MATYVLVHGGWAGGWQWKEVGKRLQAAGHEVYRPSLTGHGEREHLANPDISLDTHIQDIVNVLEYEALDAVILVGYSYSGIVITGVAERIPHRISQLVYLDAYLPRNGESLTDLLGPDLTGFVLEAAKAYGNGWVVPHDPPHADRRTPQLVKPALDPVTLGNPMAATIPRTFVHCTAITDPPNAFVAPIARRAQEVRSDPRWQYREIAAEHGSCWETHVDEVAELLLELV